MWWVDPGLSGCRHPALIKHLSALGVPLRTWTAPWVICMFSTSLPPETVLRVWDCIILTSATDAAVGGMLGRPEPPQFTDGSQVGVSLWLNRVSSFTIKRPLVSFDLLFFLTRFAPQPSHPCTIALPCRGLRHRTLRVRRD